MTQKRREADSGKAIRETMALRWEPTHITKPNPRVVPLQVVHRLCSSCINSVENLTGTPLSFLCQLRLGE